MVKTDKEKKLIEYIKKNPTKSGNQIYKETQKKGISVRKTYFYDILREVRNLPEPSQAKRKKSIPLKYKVKKPTPRIKIPRKVGIPRKKEKYGVVQVKVKNNKDRWVKYKSRADLERQIDILQSEYDDIQLGSVQFIYKKLRMYVKDVKQQFREMLA